MPFLTLMTGEREKQQLPQYQEEICIRLPILKPLRNIAIWCAGTVSGWDLSERRDTGISIAWLHHKGPNRHHYEYWIDYHIRPDGTVHYEGNKMPIRFVAEMFCDRLAASKIYLKEKYTDASPFEYYDNAREVMLIHPETAAELEKMLLTLKNEGEEAAFAYVRRRLKEEKKQ